MEMPISVHTDRLISEFLSKKNITVDVRREDLIDIEVSGNKWRKLFYNIKQAKLRGNDTLLTFGGAYSNHIAALAAIGKREGFNTIGIIRGEEHTPLNNTLSKATADGMLLHYVDRTSYKQKHTWDFKESLRETFGSFYLIPEGGSNYYGTNGCMEILNEEDSIYNYIVCPAGTGCTAAGIAMSLKSDQQLLVFPALKGGAFLKDEIRSYVNEIINDDELTNDIMSRVNLIADYHFGGYAKSKPELIDFVKRFKKEYDIQWDAIYNGKMAFGIFDLIKQDFFGNKKKILLIHTGGLQGLSL